MTENTYYPESFIQAARDIYAEFHGIETDTVDVCRNFAGPLIVGFRLSAEGKADERYGQWGGKVYDGMPTPDDWQAAHDSWAAEGFADRTGANDLADQCDRIRQAR